MTKRKRSRSKQNGWVQRIRKDPNGKYRPMRILIKNGKEVEHHWLDIKNDPDYQEFYVKDFQHIFTQEMRKDPVAAVAKMTNEERVSRIDILTKYSTYLENIVSHTNNNNEKRRAEREVLDVKLALREIDNYQTKYSRFNHVPKPYPKSKAKTIDPDVMDSIFELQEDESEWGGGINFKMNNVKNPAKVVARQGAKSTCKTDILSDTLIHTHPSREFDDLVKFNNNSHYGMELNNAIDNLDELKKKRKSEKSLNKIDSMKSELTKPFDFLPSARDIENTRLDYSERTHAVVSDEGTFVITRSKNASIDPDLEKKIQSYHFDVMYDSLLKTDLKGNMNSIKEAEDRVQQYKRNVIEGTKSMLTSEGFDAEFYPKGDLVDVIVEPTERRRHRRQNEEDYFVE